jgi:hypothetical protein
MKVQLSEAFAKTATCPPNRAKQDYWNANGDPMGLVLEVRRSGGKTWYLRYTDMAGAARALKLGSLADLSFAQARALARKKRSEVLLGGDPLSARKAKRATPQFAALAAQHIEHAKSYQRSWWSVARRSPAFLRRRRPRD